MSLTLTNNAHGVSHVIVGDTTNNSLIWFTDLVGGALHGTPGPVCTFALGLFGKYIFRETKTNKVEI